MKTTLLPLLIATLLISLSNVASARYARVETQDVPVERILANLTEQIKAEPENVELLHHLARTHAIAYSNKLGDADTVKAWTGWGRGKKGPARPWFGYQPPHVPYNQVKPTEDEDKQAAAKAHLAAAIATYKKAIAAKPDDTKLKLGLAWCQDQAGEKEAALEGYRAVAAAAWETESKRRGGLGNFVYVETGKYIKALLDADKDAEEIADIDPKTKKLLSLPR